MNIFSKISKIWFSIGVKRKIVFSLVFLAVSATIAIFVYANNDAFNSSDKKSQENNLVLSTSQENTENLRYNEEYNAEIENKDEVNHLEENINLDNNDKILGDKKEEEINNKENDKDKKEDKDEDDEKKEDKKIEPNPCFNISGKKYNENTFYLGILKLNADCSKNSKEYQWYINGNSAGTGETYSFYYKKASLRVNVKNPVEIKLISTSSDGLSASVTKTITFREIPEPKVCFNLESSDVDSFVLGEEYEFDAGCSSSSSENPIVGYSWKFRDGDEDSAVVEDGIKVKHTFKKIAEEHYKSECGPNVLVVELSVETKLGANSNNVHLYCAEEQD